MADERSYTLRLIIEAINKADGVLNQVGAKVNALTTGSTKASQTTEAAVQGASAGLDRLGQAVVNARTHLSNLPGVGTAIAGATAPLGNLTSETIRAAGAQGLLQNALGGIKAELAALPAGTGAALLGYGALVIGVIAVVDGIKKLSQVAEESLQKFSNLKLASMQLETVWANTGRTMPIEELNKYNKAIVESSQFTTTQVTSAAKVLATFPNITDDLLPKALQAAADLAAFKGMGVESAATMLGRASEGMMMGLQRMGIRLSPAIKESKDFAAALDEISNKMSGQALNATRTYTGQLEATEKQWNSMKTAFGKWLDPAVLPGMEAHRVRVSSLGVAFKEFLENGSLQGLQSELGRVSAGMGALGDGSVVATTKILEFFNKLADASKGGEKSGWSVALDKVRDAAKWLLMTNVLTSGLTAVEGIFAKLGETIWADRITQGAKKAGDSIKDIKFKQDWELEIKRAQDYFARLESNAKTSLESQKILIWQQAASKEQAEAAISRLDAQATQERIARAQHERDVMIAFTRQDFTEKSMKLANRIKDPQERMQSKEYIDLQRKQEEEINKINEKARKDLSSDRSSRQGELQKEYDSRLEIQKRMEDETKSTRTALEGVSMTAMNEYDKLGVKFRQAQDTLRQAVDELPRSPERAIELAKQAQQAFAGLQQDVAGLQKNLRDTVVFFRNLEGQVAATGLEGMEKRQAEINQMQTLIRDARLLRGQGLLAESEAAFKEAGQKAAALAQTGGIMGQEDARQEAQQWLSIIKAEAVNVAKDRLAMAQAENEKIKTKIIEAGQAVADALESKLKNTNNKIGELTDAIGKLTNVINKIPLPQTPSAAAQQEAGIKQLPFNPQSPEKAQAEKAAQDAKKAEAAIDAAKTTTDLAKEAMSPGGTGEGERIITEYYQERQRLDNAEEIRRQRTYEMATRAQEGRSIAVDRESGEPKYQYAQMTSWGGYSFKKQQEQDKDTIEKNQALQEVQEDWRRRGGKASIEDTMRRSKEAEDRIRGINRKKITEGQMEGENLFPGIEPPIEPQVDPSVDKSKKAFDRLREGYEAGKNLLDGIREVPERALQNLADGYKRPMDKWEQGGAPTSQTEGPMATSETEGPGLIGTAATRISEAAEIMKKVLGDVRITVTLNDNGGGATAAVEYSS